MEQIVVRNLPTGTKAGLRNRAARNHRAVEAEVREILATAARQDPPTLVELLAAPDNAAEIEFEPERLGLTARSADL